MTDRPVDHIEHLRRPLIDRAREAHYARTSSNVGMKDSVLAAVETTNYTLADRLWKAATIAGITIGGDLLLADKLAGCQHAWNTGDTATAMDRLLEAHSHIRREMGVQA